MRRCRSAVEQGAAVLQLVAGVALTLELVAGADRYRGVIHGPEDRIAHARKASRLGVGRYMPGVAEVRVLDAGSC